MEILGEASVQGVFYTNLLGFIEEAVLAVVLG